MAKDIRRTSASTVGMTVILLAACSVPQPSALSIRPSIGPTGSARPSLTPNPATPSPSAVQQGRIVIRVAGQRLAYLVDTCPLPAWQDPAVDDGLSFGSYPEAVISGDGTMWLTHMFVLEVQRDSAADWSFVLTADLDGTPAEIERIVSSNGGNQAPMTVELSAGKATFTTVFVDSARADPARQRNGTVTVTCR